MRSAFVWRSALLRRGGALVLRRVFVLVGIGVVIGTAASMWAS
jgi:hypothetical protein